MAINVDLCGVHKDRWKVVANCKDKLLVRSALYKKQPWLQFWKLKSVLSFFFLPTIYGVVTWICRIQTTPFFSAVCSISHFTFHSLPFCNIALWRKRRRLEKYQSRNRKYIHISTFNLSLTWQVWHRRWSSWLNTSWILATAARGHSPASLTRCGQSPLGTTPVAMHQLHCVVVGL